LAGDEAKEDLDHVQPGTARRGSFHSVQDLEDTIRAYITKYNTRAKPFRWIKTADYLLGKIKGKQIIIT